MSSRKFAAIVVATLTIGTTILTGGSAHAEDSAATTAAQPAAAQRPDAPQTSVGVMATPLSTAQLAKRDEFAKRAGISPAAVTGPWHLRNGNAYDKCLTTSGAGTGNNTVTVIYTCDFSWPYNEEWYLEDLGGGWYHLRNGNAYDKCLTTSGAGTGNNTVTVIYTCDYNSPWNEEWYLESLGGSWWHLRNGNAFDKCLTTSGAGTGNNTQTVIYTCDYNFPWNEEWSIEY